MTSSRDDRQEGIGVPIKVSNVGVVVGVAALLGITAVVARSSTDATIQALKDDAKTARAEASFAVSKSKAAEAFATSQIEIVTTLQKQRDAAAARAAKSEKRSIALDAQFHTLAAAAPDTCGPVIAAADSALAVKDSIIAEKDTALAAADTIAARLRLSVDSLRQANANLIPATEFLASTQAALAAKLTHREPFYIRIVPHLGFGLAAGVDALGTPHLIAGITLGWSK